MCRVVNDEHPKAITCGSHAGGEGQHHRLMGRTDGCALQYPCGFPQYGVGRGYTLELDTLEDRAGWLIRRSIGRHDRIVTPIEEPDVPSWQRGNDLTGKRVAHYGRLGLMSGILGVQDAVVGCKNPHVMPRC